MKFQWPKLLGMAQANSSPVSVKFIKGVPYFVDSDNNAYLFSKIPGTSIDITPVQIGTVNESTITLYSDWQGRAEDFLQRFRGSITPYERIEHTKVVKYTKKPTTRNTKAKNKSKPEPQTQSSDTTSNVPAASAAAAIMPVRRKKPSTKVQSAAGQTT